MEKTILIKLRNDMCYKLYLIADMSRREFAKFWSLDHTQVSQLVQKKAQEVAEKQEKGA